MRRECIINFAATSKSGDIATAKWEMSNPGRLTRLVTMEDVASAFPDVEVAIRRVRTGEVEQLGVLTFAVRTQSPLFGASFREVRNAKASFLPCDEVSISGRNVSGSDASLKLGALMLVSNDRPAENEQEEYESDEVDIPPSYSTNLHISPDKIFKTDSLDLISKQIEKLGHHELQD